MSGTPDTAASAENSGQTPFDQARDATRDALKPGGNILNRAQDAVADVQKTIEDGKVGEKAQELGQGALDKASKFFEELGNHPGRAIGGGLGAIFMYAVSTLFSPGGWLGGLVTLLFVPVGAVAGYSWFGKYVDEWMGTKPTTEAQNVPAEERKPAADIGFFGQKLSLNAVSTHYTPGQKPLTMDDIQVPAVGMPSDPIQRG